jgi:hypothetical protein
VAIAMPMPLVAAIMATTERWTAFMTDGALPRAPLLCPYGAVGKQDAGFSAALKGRSQFSTGQRPDCGSRRSRCR